MIELNNLSKKYGDTFAVNDVSFTVSEGENLVLLGTSGCGKTTTLRMINRLTEPSSGSIKINGTDILSQSAVELRRNIGYTLQHTGLFPHYTAGENISIVPKLLKWRKEDIEDRIFELLEKLHLPKEMANAYPADLSGGQQQRVGLARALAANPPLLLMDEPFGALDPVTRSGIRKDFIELDELKRKTIVMVTHDVQEAFELGDRICLMDNGKIVQIGKPAELLFNPANEFVKSFLEEQQFMLEMRSLTITDIWEELKGIYEKGDNILHPSISVWSALELLSKKENQGKSFSSEINGQLKLVNASNIIAAYNTCKTALTHE